MYSQVSALTTLFSLRDALLGLVTQLDKQQKESTTNGLELYNLGEFVQAPPYLTIGACAGNPEAQYALAEILRRQDNTLSDEAKDWYRRAAAKGHVYAMMRLGDEASLKNAKALAQASVERNEAQGMLTMYELTQDIAWLKKSAEAGLAEAQYILADKYYKDETLITDAIVRRTTIDGLLKKAADAGFSKAIFWYGNRRPVAQDLPARRQWVEKRAQLNDVNGVLDYGLALTGFYENDEGVDLEYGFEKDLVKGYGLIWLVIESTRELSRHSMARSYLVDLGTEMTDVQIAAAKAFALQWKASHGPMSQYRLSYNDIN